MAAKEMAAWRHQRIIIISGMAWRQHRISEGNKASSASAAAKIKNISSKRMAGSIVAAKIKRNKQRHQRMAA